MKRSGRLLHWVLAACVQAATPVMDAAANGDPHRPSGVRPVQHVAAPESPSDWSVAHALATGPRCGIDEIVHRIQGQPHVRPDGGEVVCPELPSGLDPKYGVSASPLFYFDRSIEHEAEAARIGYPGYVLEGWMRDVGPPGSPKLECTYVGCTKLQVAAQGNATTGIESCLGPLTVGTSQPALHAKACPAAVMIGGAFRPFMRVRALDAPADAWGPVCCYTIPAPIPPAPRPPKVTAAPRS